MTESVFIETTIPSYYVARRARDIVQAARQQLAIEWWDRHRTRYELLSSQIVLDELARGEKAMAESRLKLLAGVPLLVINEAVIEIAEELLRDGGGSSKGGRRRVSHRLRGCSPRRLPADLELHSHCQSPQPPSDRALLRSTPHHNAGNLHAGRIRRRRL